MIGPTPRVSRETRNLLTAALVALLVLWGLARVRFPERPATPNPVPPLLDQFTARASFADLSVELTRLQRQLGTLLVAIPVSRSHSAAHAGALTGLRVGDGAAVVRVDSESVVEHSGLPLIAREPATGLSVVLVDDRGRVARPSIWVPDAPTQPRYFVVAMAFGSTIALDPVAVPALQMMQTPAWSEPIWMVPPETRLRPGSFVFTAAGDLVGLVVDEASGTVIVPGDVVLNLSAQLQRSPPAVAPYLGVHVQSLTPQLQSVTGARTGVIVTWVDPEGPSAATLTVGDVLQTIDGRSIDSVRQWEVMTARLGTASATVTIVRNRDSPRDLLIGGAPHNSVPLMGDGLTARAVPGVGSEVVRVQRGSIADHAGLRRGDLITLAGDRKAPPPELIRRLVRSPGSNMVLLGVTRDDRHLVLALERPSGLGR
jgi:hypothetical protein